MRLKRIVPLIASVLSMQSIADEYIRYNGAGYFTAAPKRVLLISENNLSGRNWDVTDNQGNSILSGQVGESKIGKGEHSAQPYNHKVDLSRLDRAGEYKFTLHNSPAEPVTIKVKDSPYEHVIGSNLRWLKVQRSGTEDVLDRPASHFGDERVFIYRKADRNSNQWENWVEDENGKTADALGGWYIAGHYSKYTVGIAYTTYYLLRAYDANPELFRGKPELSGILDEARIGAEYLLKMRPDSNEFIIQVGGFDNENGVRLPSDNIYDGRRIAYSDYSIVDLAWTATALARASQVFSDAGDKDFGRRCLEMAKELYEIAIGPDAVMTSIYKGYAPFEDTSKEDNLLMASAELYRVTGDARYLTNAKSYADQAKNAWWAGWQTKHMAGHLLLAEHHAPSRNYFMADLNHFNGIAEGNFWGFPIDYGAAHLYTALQIGFSAAEYSLVAGQDKFDKLIAGVADYTFGVNNWGVSFIPSPLIPNSVKNLQAPIYKLQKRLFPEGAVVLGPCEAGVHDSQSRWILDDLRVHYCAPFNTSAVKYYDHSDDFMTSDAQLFGAANSIYFLTLATTHFAK